MSAPTNPHSNVTARLEESTAVISLRAEAAVSKTLRQCRWSTIHGFYYRDGETSKDREGDVVARRIWLRNHGERYYRVYVTLVVECKSMNGYHFVFSNLEKVKGSLALYAWLGETGRVRERVEETLRNHISLLSSPGLVRRFERRAYPRRFPLIQRLLVEPPAAPVTASAFRETNIGKEREIGQSVLWNASQSVRSAIRSIRDSAILQELGILRESIKDLVGHGAIPRDAALISIRYALRGVNLFHPVVVLDAPLWKLEATAVTPVGWVRLVQLDPAGGVTWWTDVVAKTAFHAYAEEVSEHYSTAFRKQGTISIRALDVPAQPDSRWS